MELLFVCLAAHDSEFRRWPDGVDRRICQTFAASPAEPGELLLGFSILGGAAAWPLAARAQQPDRVRRIGVLSGGGAADDPDAQGYIAAFLQGLQQLGWTDGRNMRIDTRWGRQCRQHS